MYRQNQWREMQAFALEEAAVGFAVSGAAEPARARLLCRGTPCRLMCPGYSPS